MNIRIPLPAWLFNWIVGRKRIDDLERRAELTGTARASSTRRYLGGVVEVETDVTVLRPETDPNINEGRN